MVTQAPAKPGQGQAAAAAVPSIPFRAGVQPNELIDYNNVTTQTTSAQNLPLYTVKPNSWQKGFWIETSISYPSNAVATLVLQTASPFVGQNAPFTFWNTVTFSDISNLTRVGGATFSGWDLAMCGKYFGYTQQGDPRADPEYSFPLTGTPTGAYFALYLPVEVASRTALGSLKNTSSQSALSIQLTLESSTNIFSTGPTNPAVVTTKISSEGYFSIKVPGTAGAPPAPGATQYILKGSYPVGAGSQDIILTQGLGFPIRNIMLVNYDAAGGTRVTGDANFPDPMQFSYLGTNALQKSKKLWKGQMARKYGFTAATATVPEAALSLDLGVYVLSFCDDFSNSVGDELGNAYLPTEAGSLLQFIGSWALASNCYAIVNYISAPNNSIGSLRAGGR
jgi:hypothetical protein